MGFVGFFLALKGSTTQFEHSGVVFGAAAVGMILGYLFSLPPKKRE
jgi:hypothetical protein